MNVLTGVVGALIGLSGVLLGAWITGRAQDRRWLREQKLKAATDLVTAATHLYESQLHDSDQRRLSPAERVAWQERLSVGRAQIHLLCDAGAREAAGHLSHLTWRHEGTPQASAEADVVAALQSLTARIRQEIHA